MGSSSLLKGGHQDPSGFDQESKEVTTDEVDNQSTHEADSIAMDRDYDYKSNKSSAAKRVRKGPQVQEPSPSAAGPSSSTIKAAPVQAIIAGIPTTIPPPEDPVNLYDVEDFLCHLEGVLGIAKPPRNREKSEDALLSILGKWNSVYTIQQNPAANVAENRGREVGRNLARLAITTKREGLLKHLHDYFKKLEIDAENNQREFTEKDHQEYAEFGCISWVYMTLSQLRFAKYACYGITETTHAGGVFQRQQEKNRLARLQDELNSNKVIENQGGMVFGSGVGARGGFEFRDVCSMGFIGLQGGTAMGGPNNFSREQGGGTLAGGSTSFTVQQYDAMLGGSSNLTENQCGGALAGGSTSFTGKSDEGARGDGSGSGTMGCDPFGDD